MRLKTPSIGRLLALFGLLAAPAPASAQGDVWTEEQAVARALANPDVKDALEGRIRADRAEVEAATVVPTPTLEVAHEQVFGDEQVAYLESTVGLHQQLDLSSWRGRLRETLPHREAALRAETDEWRLLVATSVRAAFFEVRYREERLRALDEWMGHLERGVAVSTARQERGDASLYDLRRVQRELETAAAQRAREEAILEEAWAALRTWSQWTSRPTLTGALPPDGLSKQASETLPELRRLQHLELALSAEEAAWGSPFWRGWSIGAGYRFAEAGSESGHGFVASLSIPLAFWNNDLPEIDRLRAEQAAIGGELRFGRTLAEQAEAAAGERLERALAVLSNLRVPERDAELTHLAETAYGAGEATLTELLDAYESETELALSRIDLQWEARRAAIELDRRRGNGVPR